MVVVVVGVVVVVVVVVAAAVVVVWAIVVCPFRSRRVPCLHRSDMERTTESPECELCAQVLIKHPFLSCQEAGGRAIVPPLAPW